MKSRISHKLLIYHLDSKIYEKILSRRLPHLEIHSAAHPEEGLDVIEDVEIILSWEIPDELLKGAKRLRWFSSMTRTKVPSRWACIACRMAWSIRAIGPA